MSRTTAPQPSPQPRRGFTLLELLVSMGIIALLAMILLPVVVLARRHARDATCKSNLSQLWKATNTYANNSANEVLFPNVLTPLRISNVIYTQQQPSAWGYLYPTFIADNRMFFCPGDPVRDVEWTYGWANWETEEGEVQCSYGYRGGQELVTDPTTQITLSVIEVHPRKVFAAEYYERFTTPARVNHPNHINVLRCNGQVEQSDAVVSFGPEDDDFVEALDLLDR